MGYLLGIDLGSSSVKVSVVDAESGVCVASASAPESEAPIKALQPGWAEQRSDDWWQYLKDALRKVENGLPHPEALSSQFSVLSSTSAIGISYQMHGLVCLDKDLRPLRDAIIWCDSRGVPYGERAYRELGEGWCMSHLRNSPGNFTAAKLAWVREHEPELFEKIRYIMLPGDWLALRLTGVAATTACGLSEMMLWDFAEGAPATAVMDYSGFPHEIFPPLVPTFGEQGRVGAEAARELGLPAGVPITYRAGDQPNNALSLGVLEPGQVASTAGTSGVVYGVVESGKMKVESGKMKVESYPGAAANLSTFHSPLSTRINTFLHVNHTLGLMHCINGCGIQNAWMRRMVAPGMGYDDMNRLAATVAAGSEGLSVIPFGNGAERVLLNRNVGASVHGIDLNRHGQAHLLRAAQEGVAFAFMLGMEQMGPMSTIHAGQANMYLSPVFRQTLADVSGAMIGLYDTDGSVGAARGAGLGAGIYASASEAFARLQRLAVVEPRRSEAVDDAYSRWKDILYRQTQRD